MHHPRPNALQICLDVIISLHGNRHTVFFSKGDTEYVGVFSFKTYYIVWCCQKKVMLLQWYKLQNTKVQISLFWTGFTQHFILFLMPDLTTCLLATPFHANFVSNDVFPWKNKRTISKWRRRNLPSKLETTPLWGVPSYFERASRICSSISKWWSGFLSSRISVLHRCGHYYSQLGVQFPVVMFFIVSGI